VIRRFLPLLILGLALSSPPVAEQSRRAPVLQKLPLRYQVIAGDLRLNRRLMGPVTGDVRGVPAAPVDSMCYDGDGHRKIEGQAILEVDVVNQRGMMRAWWRDDRGLWELKQDRFYHPHHASGLYIGSTRRKLEEAVNLGIVQNVYLHGDTGAGPAGQPTVFVYLGSWGNYEVTLDGEPFPNPYGLPGPELWHGHGHVTEGVRDEDDGTVRTVDGEIYDPKRHASVGATDRNDLEFHLAFHDERFPMTRNRPALFDFEYHLIFEDVMMRVTDSQQPLSFDAYEVGK